tara:strand:- start:609 stop:914 length:306 start_codon:yes stop_codon:yes gene_type:complete
MPICGIGGIIGGGGIIIGIGGGIMGCCIIGGGIMGCWYIGGGLCIICPPYGYYIIGYCIIGCYIIGYCIIGYCIIGGGCPYPPIPIGGGIIPGGGPIYYYG